MNNHGPEHTPEPLRRDNTGTRPWLHPLMAVAPFLDAMRQRGMAAYRDIALTEPIV